MNEPRREVNVTSVVRKVFQHTAEYAKKYEVVPAGILVGAQDYIALRQLALAAMKEDQIRVIKDLAHPLRYHEDTKLLYFNGMAVYPYTPGGKVKLMPKMKDVAKLL